jgi:hypothetical protein
VHLVYICISCTSLHIQHKEKTTAFLAYPVQIKREYGRIPRIYITRKRRWAHFLYIHHNKEKMDAFSCKSITIRREDGHISFMSISIKREDGRISCISITIKRENVRI